MYSKFFAWFEAPALSNEFLSNYLADKNYTTAGAPTRPPAGPTTPHMYWMGNPRPISTPRTLADPASTTTVLRYSNDEKVISRTHDAASLYTNLDAPAPYWRVDFEFHLVGLDPSLGYQCRVSRSVTFNIALMGADTTQGRGDCSSGVRVHVHHEKLTTASPCSTTWPSSTSMRKHRPGMLAFTRSPTRPFSVAPWRPDTAPSVSGLNGLRRSP